MSISKAIAHQLLNISQTVLSNMEAGRLLAAKNNLLRLTAIIAVETDRSEEIERYPEQLDS